MPPTIRRSAIVVAWIFCSLTTVFSCLFYYQHHQEWRTLRLSGISNERDNDGQSVTSQTTSTTYAQSNQPPHPPKRILLVSAFYPLSKSKHPIENYKEWLKRYLQTIESPLYFFTTPEMEGLIRGCRARHPIFINTTFERAFDVPPLQGLEVEYEKMRGKDREGFRHSPELYSVWNAKPYFLDEAVKNVNSIHPFVLQNDDDRSTPSYDYAFWVDAGSFRQDHFYQNWPDSQRVEQVFSEGSKLTGTPKDELIFFPIFTIPERRWRWWRESDGPVDFDFSEGSFFGGSPKAISWYAQTFYAQHDKYLGKGMFVGKDQTIINAIMFLNANKFVSVWVGQPPSYLPGPPSPSPPPSSSSSFPSSLASNPDDHAAMTPLQRPRLYPPPSRIFLPPSSVPPTYCGPEWYHYEFFLASHSERSLMLALWTNIRDSTTQGAWWGRRQWSLSSIRIRKDTGGGGNGGVSVDSDESVCPMKELMSVESLLKARFGERWAPIRMVE